MSTPLSFAETPADTELLESLPYLQGYVEQSGRDGVVVFDRAHAQTGLNLYNSAHTPFAGIMDLEGKLLHTWQADPEKIWPERSQISKSTAMFRRVFIYPNGDILAIWEVDPDDGPMIWDFGLTKLDRSSKLLWKFNARPHHDVTVGTDNKIYVLTRKLEKPPFPSTHKEVYLDYVTVLNPDGQLDHEISLLNLLERSAFRSLIEKKPRNTDVLHTNSLQILDGRQAGLSALFKRGNILLSILRFNMIVIIDPEAQKVVWASSGSKNRRWFHNHDAVLLANGHILFFSNGSKDLKRSEVIELDPLTDKIVWRYSGSSAKPFYSRVRGSSQRLANGNTLITESTKGRAFEVNSKDEIVWEYINPQMVQKKKKLRASLMHMHRLRRSALPWLATKTAGSEDIR